MELGIIGLGKMGGNMAERLRLGGHKVRDKPRYVCLARLRIAGGCDQGRAGWRHYPGNRP